MDRPLKNLYLVVMPVLTVFLWLGVSSIVHRSFLFGAVFPDLFVRVIVTVWFCGLYIRLSRITKYSIYPNITWKKSDVAPKEKIFYWITSVLFGILSGIFTWWAVETFVPSLESFGILIAGLNGAIIIFPLVRYYWVLKL